MYVLATTRFNNETITENITWREKNSWIGCIYNVPKRMGESIPVQSLVFVLEMNNDTNTIQGIGLVRNTVRTEKTKNYKIYNDQNYNRYTYLSKYRIDRNDLDNTHINSVFKLIESLVFKGKKHLKRGQGITRMPRWLDEYNFERQIRELFLGRFKNL
jgi:hypothetical protein